MATVTMVRGLLIPAQKKTMDKSRVEDQKAVDKALVAAIKKTELLESYLRTSFSLRHGQRPHEMVF